MKYKPMAQLVDEIARADTAPMTGTATSYPIPVRSSGGVLVASFRHRSGFDAKTRGSVCGPPDRVWLFDPTTGARVKEEVRPGGPALGREVFEVPAEEYPQLIQDFYRTYDVLLPVFTVPGPRVDAATSAAARDFKRLFARVSGKLLLPYYHQIGNEWFAWVDAAAK